MKGRWTVDAKFGKQFRVERCLSVLPSTITGIEKYLGSGLVKDIGPIMAKRVVAIFALETLDIIEEKPEKLLEVGGIGPIRAERIRKAWQEQKEIREVMVLQGHGVSTTYAVKIYKAYGDKALSIVKEDHNLIAGVGQAVKSAVTQDWVMIPILPR